MYIMCLISEKRDLDSVTSFPVITFCAQRSRGLVKRWALGTAFSLSLKETTSEMRVLCYRVWGWALEREGYVCKNMFKKPGEVRMCGKSSTQWWLPGLCLCLLLCSCKRGVPECLTQRSVIRVVLGRTAKHLLMKCRRWMKSMPDCKRVEEGHVTKY